MAEPVWQELLRLRLAERNAKESAFSPVIEQCTSMPCLFSFSLFKHRFLSDTPRSSACTTDKALEGEKCLIATCSGNCQTESQQLDRLCPGDNRRVRSNKHF